MDWTETRCFFRRFLPVISGVRYMNMKEKGKKLAVCGIALQFGPIIGLLGTTIGMIRAFRKISPQSTVQAEALAGDIGFALWATAIGLTLAVVGVPLIMIALFGLRYRAPWFYTTLIACCILWLFAFPLGTILAICLINYLMNRKKEFSEINYDKKT